MKKKYPLIFVVEDNLAYNKVVVHFLKQSGYENVMSFPSGEECLHHLYLKPDIVIQDYKLQGISGLHVLQKCKKILPDVEFIFLSSQESIEIAVNTIKYGAFDYIIKKDVALHQMTKKIENIKSLQLLKKRNRIQQIIFLLILISIFVIMGLIMFT